MYGSQMQRPPMARQQSQSFRPSTNTPRTPQANAYQSNSIMTATPGKLLLMLYDGAIRFCMLAEDAIDVKDYNIKNINLIKVQDILTELRVTLREDVAPEFSSKMKSLYIFMEKELMAANVENNKVKVTWVRKQLSDLRDTWAKVV